MEFNLKMFLIGIVVSLFAITVACMLADISLGYAKKFYKYVNKASKNKQTKPKQTIITGDVNFMKKVESANADFMKDQELIHSISHKLTEQELQDVLSIAYLKAFYEENVERKSNEAFNDAIKCAKSAARQNFDELWFKMPNRELELIVMSQRAKMINALEELEK